jgi:hypothetical protein
MPCCITALLTARISGWYKLRSLPPPPVSPPYSGRSGDRIGASKKENDTDQVGSMYGYLVKGKLGESRLVLRLRILMNVHWTMKEIR